MIKKSHLACALGLALLSSLASANPIQPNPQPNTDELQLIKNGGFENGNLYGWSSADQRGGDTGISQPWRLSTGAWTATDTNGLDKILTVAGDKIFLPTAGPASGNYYAITDTLTPGAHALWQSFIVPIGATSVVLSFDMFRNDYSGTIGLTPAVDPAGLDFRATPNQHARVDITKELGPRPLFQDFFEDAFSTAAADVIANLVAPGVDVGPNPNPYTSYLFDITGLVTAGTTYNLRFGEVDNQLYLNQGVDNVSILAHLDSTGSTTLGQVPEPTILPLLGLGFVGLAISRRRTRT